MKIINLYPFITCNPGGRFSCSNSSAACVSRRGSSRIRGNSSKISRPLVLDMDGDRWSPCRPNLRFISCTGIEDLMITMDNSSHDLVIFIWCWDLRWFRCKSVQISPVFLHFSKVPHMHNGDCLAGRVWKRYLWLSMSTTTSCDQSAHECPYDTKSAQVAITVLPRKCECFASEGCRQWLVVCMMDACKILNLESFGLVSQHTSLSEWVRIGFPHLQCSEYSSTCCCHLPLLLIHCNAKACRFLEHQETHAST